MAKTKILITIKSGTTPIGFGNLQKDDGISVAHGGLGINYVAPNRILLGNSSLPVNTMGLNNLQSSPNVSATTNTNTIIGNQDLKLEVQEDHIAMNALKGTFPFGRIGPAISDARFEEGADDFGSEAGVEF